MKQFIRREEDCITSKDWMLIILVTSIYAIISFVNLGNLSNPQTFWESFTTNEKITLKLESTQDINRLRVYTGPVTGNYALYISNEEQLLGNKVLEFKPKSVFAWEDISVKGQGKYLSIVALDKGLYLGEISVYDNEKKLDALEGNTPESSLILDEQSLIPDKINYLNSTYFDEIYHARTAYEHIHKLKPYEWTHPPLGKVIMGLPLLVMGMTPFAYRLMGNLVGILMIPIIYILAKRLFKDTRLAFLVGLMMACDGMHFVQTRIATVDSYLVLFIMLAYLFMYEYTLLKQHESLGKKLRKLLLSGIFLGCAIATKWTGAYAAVGLCIFFFYDFIKRYKTSENLYLWKKKHTPIILWCFLFFIFIPVGIYIASYIPFFRTPDSDVNSFGELIKMQKQMYDYHSKLTATHPFSSAWYTWPLDVRPVWYYDGQQVGAGNISTIAAFGNPIIWWVGVIGIIYTIKEAIVNRGHEEVFLTIAIGTAYIPYAFIGRVMFIYHFFPVVPFMMLAIAKLMKDLVEKTGRAGIIKIYSILLVVSFMFFYPVYSGLEVSRWWIWITAWLPWWDYFKSNVEVPQWWLRLMGWVSG